MALPLSDLLVSMRGDTTQFRSQMTEARRTATGTTLSIVKSFEQVERQAKASAAGVRAAGGAISQLAGAAGPAAGKVTVMGNAMLQAFAGGPLVAGIAAVGLGLTTLVGKVKEAQDAMEAAAQKQLEEWQKVEQAVSAVTQGYIEQLKAKKLLAGGEDKETVDLQVQIEEQSKKLAAAQVVAADATQKLADAQAALLDGTLDSGSFSPVDYIATLEAAAEKAAAKVIELNGRLAFLWTQKDLVLEGAGQASAIDGSPLLTPGEKKAGLGVAPPPKPPKDQRAAILEAQRVELRGYDLLIEKARILGDKTEEIRQRELRDLKALEQQRKSYTKADYELAQANIRDTATKQRAEVAKAAAREQADYELAQQARVAAATKSKTDDIRAQMEQEVEAVRRKVEDEVIVEEEGHRRITAIRARHRQAIIDAIDKEAKAEQEAVKKKVLDQEKITGQALQVGFAAGASLMQGMKEAVESGDGRAALKGILAAASGILSAFGPLGMGAGAGLGMISGFFSKGGIIDGPGGPTDDNHIVAVSAGEAITKASSVSKFGRAFMRKLNEGVIDLTLLNHFATGGIVGEPAMASSPAVAGGPTVHNEFHLKSFDSVDALGGLRRALGPAIIYRNSLRQAEVERQSMSRWVR
ncbi:MAG TPA: hypothetical protein VGD74_05525 [Vulgatibacter sp.]